MFLNIYTQYSNKKNLSNNSTAHNIIHMQNKRYTYELKHKYSRFHKQLIQIS